jgi:hypothetical protein
MSVIRNLEHHLFSKVIPSLKQLVWNNRLVGNHPNDRKNLLHVDCHGLFTFETRIACRLRVVEKKGIREAEGYNDCNFTWDWDVVRWELDVVLNDSNSVLVVHTKLCKLRG